MMSLEASTESAELIIGLVLISVTAIIYVYGIINLSNSRCSHNFNLLPKQYVIGMTARRGKCVPNELFEFQMTWDDDVVRSPLHSSPLSSSKTRKRSTVMSNPEGFDMSGVALATIGAVDTLACQLRQHGRVLVSLCLRDCSITDESIGAIQDVLQGYLMTLVHLDLSGNSIEKKGCVALSTMVARKQCQLQSIDLSFNMVGPGGAKALAAAITSNATLTSLDLSFQKKGAKIGPDGTTCLAKCLQTNTVLKTLKLARNNIGFEGCRHIASALKINSCLTELDIGQVNYITIAGALQLAQVIASNRSTRLAWLTIGQHRFPIAPIIGDRRLPPPSQRPRGSRAKRRSSFGHWVGLRRDSSAGRRRSSSTATSAEAAGAGAGTGVGHDLGVEQDMGSGMSPFGTTGDGHAPGEGVPWGHLPVCTHPRILGLRRLQSDGYRGSFTSTTAHGMDDELAVCVATLLRRNRSLQYLCLDKCFLPIQQLLGNALVEDGYLDLSDQGLTTIDAIIVGSLVAENKLVNVLDLKDNDFAGSEGENFICNALERNRALRLNTFAWSPRAMFADGYKAMAACQGMSASGMTIEPQRLEGCFYQSLTGLSAVLFYISLFSDVMTLWIYASDPKVYNVGWLVVLAMILCAPTVLYVFNALRNLLLTDWRQAVVQSVIIILQITPYIQARDCIAQAMESTEMLDYKFVQAIYRSIPNIFTQMAIIFSVANREGNFSLWSLFSAITSLVSITVIFIMLFDRKAARKISMGSIDQQPACSVGVAAVFTAFGMGSDTEEVRGFVNYNSYYTSHYCWAYVYQVLGLTTRIVSIAWLVSSVPSACNFFIFLTPFVVRLLMVLAHDNHVFSRSAFNNFVFIASLCISDSAWQLSDDEAHESRDALISVTFVSTCENLIALFYCFFLNPSSKIPDTSEAVIFALIVFGMALKWGMIFIWVIPVHLPSLRPTRSRRHTLSWEPVDQGHEQSQVRSQGQDLKSIGAQGPAIRQITGGRASTFDTNFDSAPDMPPAPV